MIIGLILMLFVLFVSIGLIMNEVLEDIEKIDKGCNNISKIHRSIKFNLFSIVFCSNLFGILSVILLSLK
jgi:hypothetical protein